MTEPDIWLQCTECGWGRWVFQWQIDCGDFTINSACPCCGVGLVKPAKLND